MSLAKLTSLSTQTLSSLLERQRLPNPPPSSTQAILRNLSQLRTGILALEAKLDLDLGSYGSDMGASKTRKSEREAVGLLRNQFGRMRNMLGEAAEGVEALPPPANPSPTSSPAPVPEIAAPTPIKNQPFVPYSDDPPSSPDQDDEPDAHGMLEQQRLLMEEQDAHLASLTRSITAQRDISIQINTELDEHNEMLEELGQGLDHTGSRLSNARKKLDRFARGVKGNMSTYIIAGLIFVLLILIIIFKT